jgi:hypothetical protein
MSMFSILFHAKIGSAIKSGTQSMQQAKVCYPPNFLKVNIITGTNSTGFLFVKIVIIPYKNWC